MGVIKGASSPNKGKKYKIYTNCVKCGIELTENNKYKSVNKYCKKCQNEFSKKSRIKWEENNPLDFKVQKLYSSYKRELKGNESATLTKEEIKSKLIDAIEKKCEYCEDIIDLNNASLDHKMPISRSGNGNPDNIQIICRKCNGRKASLTSYEFEKLLEFLKNYPDMKGIILARMAMGGIVFKHKLKNGF